MNTEAGSLEPIARALFKIALCTPGKSGEVLWRLLNGDAVTVDPITHQIVFLPMAMIEQLTDDAG